MSISSDLVDCRGDRPRLTVKLSPKAAAERIDGVVPGSGANAPALKISVTAAPEKGKANAALIRFLAKQLGVGRAAVRIVSGETSRRKRVEIAAPAAQIEAAITRHLDKRS